MCMWSNEVIIYIRKNLDICVNLELVAGSRRTGEGLDGLVRVRMY